MPITPTPLVVEDGSIVTGANSFVSVDDAAQFLFDRGLVKQNDIDDADGEGLLRRGLDAIRHLSCLADYSLPLSEPIEIPTGLIEAQIWAAYYIWSGLEDAGHPASANDPANVPQSGIKREKVDVLEVEYKESQIRTGVSLYDMTNVRLSLESIGCTSLSVVSRRLGRA